ncbi:5'-nucleotidase [Desulfosporosinus sp. HMP52]|uniref:5'-nucleotidase C-terminal domain-containing protein n=1 Tax=Desulfosporosinus sp. HMP52 TaxID=1487923 RepID=UPI00051FAA7C|nr:5'-nucleotidase C-terminal domain-containing protein [Desulfosporosinus sp. HMP52]KGK88941.1 5'-nucleotidase [Desulfosporosinus sp. HMP52]
MKKTKGLIGSIIVSMLLIISFCTMAWASSGKRMADLKTITILHTNDTHSRVVEGEYDGIGFAKLAAMFKEFKAQNPNTLVLDAGDTFHGQTVATLLRGESIAKLMNIMGYDAMTPGNHDFNYGYQRLLELDEITNFPILSANVKTVDGTRVLTPFVIKEVEGIKIGIIGLSTPETAYKTHPKNVAGLKFTDPVEEARVMVSELKEKVDVMVVLAHLGMDPSSQDTSIKLAQAVPQIDLIVDGHSHTTLNEGMMIGNTLIVSAGEYDKNLGSVQLTFEGKKLIGKQAKLVTKEDAEQTPDDQDVLKTINGILAENKLILSQVIGKTAVKLEGERERVRKGETNLGNLIADAIISESGADVAIVNGGGIRASIEAGPITKGQIITVLPFGNFIVTKKVKGTDIKAALENGLKSYPELSGGFPHVSGIKYTIDPSKSAGEKVTEIIFKGNPLDLNQDYILAVNDFMASGGDGYSMLADDAIANEYPALDEIVINFIQAKQVVDPQVEGRIVEKQAIGLGPTIEPAIYIVKPGDVLYRIAKQFGTTWQKLQELNQLKNPHLIFPGQNIIVPVSK